MRQSEGKKWQPSEYSRLCSSLFEDSALVVSPSVIASIGFKKKSLRLKLDAIPTLFDYNNTGDEHLAAPLQASSPASSERSTIPNDRAQRFMRKRRREVLAGLSHVLPFNICETAITFCIIGDRVYNSVII